MRQSPGCWRCVSGAGARPREAHCDSLPCGTRTSVPEAGPGLAAGPAAGAARTMVAPVCQAKRATVDTTSRDHSPRRRRARPPPPAVWRTWACRIAEGRHPCPWAPCSPSRHSPACGRRAPTPPPSATRRPRATRRCSAPSTATSGFPQLQGQREHFSRGRGDRGTAPGGGALEEARMRYGEHGRASGRIREASARHVDVKVVGEASGGGGGVAGA